MKPLNYIIYEENDEEFIGFNRHNTSGYVDHNPYEWSDDETWDYEQVLAQLEDGIFPWEFGSFTYQINDKNYLIEILNKLELKEQKAAWLTD